MSLLSRRQNVQEVPPELQPYYHETRDRTRLFGIVGGILLVLLAIGLAIFFMSWRHRHNTSAPKPSTSQSQQKKSTTNGSNSGIGKVTFPAVTGTTNSGQSSTTTPSTATNSSSNTSTSPSTIPNTGAGDVVVIFATAGLTGVIGYQVYLRKKVTA